MGFSQGDGHKVNNPTLSVLCFRLEFLASSVCVCACLFVCVQYVCVVWRTELCAGVWAVCVCSVAYSVVCSVLACVQYVCVVWRTACLCVLACVQYEIGRAH